MCPARSNGVGLRRKGKGRAATSRANAVPDVFRDMLAEELLPLNVDEPERARKRRRRRTSDENQPAGLSTVRAVQTESHAEDDNPTETEDDLDVQQAVYDDSEDSSVDSDIAWEEVGIQDYELKSYNADELDDLDLTLTTTESTKPSSSIARRKTVSKVERALRLSIHKIHILCLLSHADRRNNWCNDSSVQSALKPLITKQILEFLLPNESYSQFRMAESIKKGLFLVIEMWILKFNVTKRGMHRSFWAESENGFNTSKPSPDIDSLYEKSEFLAAAKGLKGSRDVGNQLFCSLLRGIGLEVRLVNSLQPLPFSANASAPSHAVLQESRIVARDPIPESHENEKTIDLHGDEASFSNGREQPPESAFSARRRLGHPNAADYFMPKVPIVQRPPPKSRTKKILESPYPVFWVEVLDEAHQKWMPVNPMDSTSVAKPSKFEPPASDAQNNMSYVVAFEDDGVAKDVTRRYTKAFNAKTRKTRIESTDGGEKWWRRTMRFYSRDWKNDLDQIEDTELAVAEAREPMPKNVSDFKGHPFYALERHLRRNEVIVNRREVGVLATGRDTVGKKVEKIFRRSDVNIVKSADGWYRIGRDVRLGEQPVKIVAARAQVDDDGEESERAGTALYTEAQTETYKSPPVISGRVPKNSYGNLDLFVSCMIPDGGVHIPHSEASRAARLLGVDYADAVTGFEFRGRHGTAVVKGIVAATEYYDALCAVIEGFRDEQSQAEEERRSLAALRMWRLFLVGLRIKERVDGYKAEGEEMSGIEEEIEDTAMGDDSGMESEEYIDDGGGGFFPE